jgi:hypothetical protein
MGEFIALPTAAIPAPARAKRRKAKPADTAIAAAKVINMASHRKVPLHRQPHFMREIKGLHHSINALMNFTSSGLCEDVCAKLAAVLVAEFAVMGRKFGTGAAS